MKEYCVDLEIAKQLKENGFPQTNGILYMWENGDLTTYEYQNEILGVDNEENLDSQGLLRSSTSDEILKELPHEINGFILEIIRYEDGTIEADYVRSLWRDEDTEYLIKSRKLFYKLSNCLAELWIDLKKEGYIK